MPVGAGIHGISSTSGTGIGGIARAYADGVRRVAGMDGIELVHLAETSGGRRVGATALFRTTARTLMANLAIAREVFGPSGVVVAADDVD